MSASSLARAQPAPQATSSKPNATIEAGSLHAQGKASFGKGEYQKAIEFYTKAIGLSPTYAYAWLDRGIAHKADGKFQSATTDLDKAVDLLAASANPRERAEVHVHRAQALVRLGKVPAAVNDLDRAATLQPRWSMVYAQRAYAHATAGAHNKALADVDVTLAMDTYSSAAVLARTIRATTYAAQSRHDDAVTELRQIAAGSSDLPNTLGGLRATYLLGVPNDATMTMRVVRMADAACEPNCPEWIALQGRIMAGQQGDLTKLLDRLGKKKLPILIDSIGGNVDAGVAMGRLIRQRDLDVVVARTQLALPCGDDATCKARLKGDRVLGTASSIAARCASACVYILAGGTQRVVGALSGVGLHQITFYRKYTTAPDADRLKEDRAKGRIIIQAADGPRLLGAGNDDAYIKTREYYQEMGIDRSVMEHLLVAPRQGMTWLSMTDLVSTGLATGSGIVEQYLAGKTPPPPVVTLPAPAKISPATSRADLVRDLNRELVRLACLPTMPQDMTAWSATSRAALTRYGALMGRKVASKEPSQDDLDGLRQHRRAVCPSACPPGAVEQEKLCVTEKKS